MAAAESTSPGEPIDVAVLVRVIGPEPTMLADFYVEFARGAAEALLAVEQALAAGNLGLAESVAHRLKGSAGLIGASALGDRCAHLEEACRSSSKDALRSALRMVQAEAGRVREWIETAGRPSRPAPRSGGAP